MVLPACRAAAVVLACLSSVACPGTITEAPCEGRILLNEYSVERVNGDGSAANLVTVELLNASSCTANSPELAIVAGIDTARIGKRTWAPNELVVSSARVVGLASDCASCGRLRLVDLSNGVQLDAVTVPYWSTPAVYGIRRNIHSAVFAIVQAEESTLGTPNPPVGPVVKLTDSAGFRPRDSSPNAILHFGGFLWVLSGWSNHGQDVWYASSDVWRSRDGVRWEQFNTSPPYHPYSEFVVFRGRMWALGATSSYSSVDGATWREESLILPRGAQAVTWRDAIVAVTHDSVLLSTDGAGWATLQLNAPWGAARWRPELVSGRGMLWLIGGVDQTPNGDLLYRNDVWQSRNGSEWTRLTDRAAWQPRRWFNAFFHDDRLWVMNGANDGLWPEEFGNVADIWVSGDGASWTQLDQPLLWPARHASFVVTAPTGGFLVSSGYGHGGVARMYGDVWHVDFRPTHFGGTSDSAIMSRIR